MTAEPAFLAAILADPADDAPRLIYADWLDERGESERAEFIRVQVAITVMDDAGEGQWPEDGHTCFEYPCRVCESIAKYEALQARERELLEEPRHFVNWTPAILHTGPGAGIRVTQAPRVDLTGKGFVSATFRRGFVAAVECTAADWVAHSDAILAAQPVEEARVRVEDWRDVARLDQWADRLGDCGHAPPHQSLRRIIICSRRTIFALDEGPLPSEDRWRLSCPWLTVAYDFGPSP